MRFRNANQRKAVMAKLKEYRQGGYLVEVRNPKGKMPEVQISEMGLTGYTALEKPKSGNWNDARKVGITKRNPEGMAKALARKGHKIVRILS